MVFNAHGLLLRQSGEGIKTVGLEDAPRMTAGL